MDTMQYKKIEAAMLDAMVPIFVKTFNAAPWNEPWTTETAYQRLRPLICNGGIGIACYLKKSMVGFILGVEEQDFDGKAFTIREFCIDQSMQGKKIGTSLYQKMEELLKQKGIVRINLLTLKNELPESFYQKQGYKTAIAITYMDKEL